QSIIRAAQLPTFDFMQFIELRVAAYFKRQPEELLSLSEVHGMLKQLERNYPGLQAEVLQPYFISMPQLGEVLQQLVRQGVAIKDFRAIVEAIASYCASHGITSDQPENVDIDEVVAAVRISRRRYLLAPLVSCRQRLRVCTLSPELEETLDQAEISDVRNLIAIDPVDFERARTALKEISGPIKNRGVLPFCVLCRSDLRPKVVSLLDACGELLSVVTYEELEANFPLESVGNWDI
ncbi:MAG: FHIPEP family type III secretion protein, partial [Bdellovibrionales bacterium]|nr:FHIPEP family type III secretion protein [Bdellovibrionales bacterium]